MKINKQIGNRGFTLVELMIVIVIIGVLAALASFGFIEYVKKSKSAEADEFVKKIADGAKVYYTSEQKCGGDETWHKATTDCTDDTGDTTDKTGYPVTFSHKTFCGKGTSATVDVKSMDNPPKGGGKATPKEADEEEKITWKCLNTSMKDPTYFQYLYSSSGAGGGSTGAKAYVAAQANFDSEGTGVDAASKASTATDTQVLYKNLTVDKGDVAMTPAILKNQGK